MRRRSPAVPLATLLLAACGDAEREPVTAEVPAMPAEVLCDFGVLPHGAVETRDLVIPLPAEQGAWYPVGFQRACTCALHEFLALGDAGRERRLASLPDPANAIRPGEHLVLRLTLDTNQKEPADLEATPTPGQVILQDAEDGRRRRYQPVRFTFGIDAPIAIEPYAHLDVGGVPRAIEFSRTVELTPDRAGTELGDITVVEPTMGGFAPVHDVRAELERTDGGGVLHVTVDPGDLRPDGPFAVEVRVPTNLPAPPGAPPVHASGYVLRVPVSGQVIPDITLSPPERFVFGKIEFGEPSEQRLVVTDHDPTRDAGFVCIGIVDHEGNDLRDHFELSIEPLESKPRSHVLILRFRGGLDRPWVRGEVRLAKAVDLPTIVEIPLSAIDRL